MFSGRRRSAARLNSGVRQHSRRYVDSPTHFAMSMVPAASLLAAALTWPLWPIGGKEVPATASSAGLTLLLLLLAVVAEYVAGIPTILDRGPVVLLASLAICYGAALLLFARKEGVRLWRLLLFGVVGLVPGITL